MLISSFEVVYINVKFSKCIHPEKFLQQRQKPMSVLRGVRRLKEKETNSKLKKWKKNLNAKIQALL